MKISVLENYEALSAHTASLIADELKKNPALSLCMASGSSPALTCDLLVKKIREGNIDCSRLRFMGLDEWMGLPPTNSGSCHYFFKTKLIEPLGLKPSQYFLFDALSPNPESECKKMDAMIKEKGIDIMLVGIGMNGHIGFNEPGTPFDLPCHVIELEEITKQVGQKYFLGRTELGKGITIGLGHLMNAATVILIANGESKAAVVQQAVEGPVEESFPASIMQRHKNSFVLIDKKAASVLEHG